MIVRKNATQEINIRNGLDCIMNDSRRPDSYDDICEAKPGSYIFDRFVKNSPAFLNHNQDIMAGHWKNVRVENGCLRGTLHLASPDTSPKHREIHKLVDQGILKGISIGFLSLESHPRPESKRGGRVHTKMELVEASLVAVPSQQDSLIQRCRSMNISNEIQTIVFKDATLGARIRAAKAAHPGWDLARIESDLRYEESKKRLANTLRPKLIIIMEQIAELWGRYVIALRRGDIEGMSRCQRQIGALEKREAMYIRLIDDPKPAPKPAPSTGSRWSDAQQVARKATEERYGRLGKQNEQAWEQARDEAVRQGFEDYWTEADKRRK